MKSPPRPVTRELRYDLYEYQPGNGTRYCIYARRTNPTHTGGTLALFWLHMSDVGGLGMIMDTRSPTHIDYFMEKTGVHRMGDAIALMCFARDRFGAKVRFDEHLYEKGSWAASIIAGVAS